MRGDCHWTSCWLLAHEWGAIPYCRIVPDDDELSVLVRCRQDRDTTVRLHGRYLPDPYTAGFAVEGRGAGLQVQLPGVEVYAWDEGWLPGFVGQLAEDYRGWDGERIWRTSHLSVRAVFHSGGHVALTWDLQPAPVWVDTWLVSITTWVEAGEQMSGLAADLREFLPRPGSG